jgi:HNH endonuclease
VSDEILVGLFNRLKPLKLDTDIQEIRDLTVKVITHTRRVVQPVKKKLTKLQELIFVCSTRTASGCWEWPGAITVGAKTGGYGKLAIGGSKSGLAHQVAFAIFKGLILAGLGVLHKCDNRKCFNPAHLYAGTQGDNMRDWRRKGTAAMGSAHSNAKLDEDKVREILQLNASGTSMNELARVYPVTRKRIQLIVWGIAWKHVRRAAAPKVRRKYTKHVGA